MFPENNIFFSVDQCNKINPAYLSTDTPEEHKAIQGANNWLGSNQNRTQCRSFLHVLSSSEHVLTLVEICLVHTKKILDK